MQKISRSTGALIALLASTAIASPAYAQIASAPPPKFSNVDENGVDLTTGLVSFSLTEGSIGSGAGAMSFQRIWAEDAGWVDNWTGGMYNATINGQTVTVVQIAGISETFTQSGGVYTNQKANGGTLTIAGGVATYTASDGNRINFAAGNLDIPGLHCPGAVAGTCWVPDQIILTNGVKFSFGHEESEHCLYYQPGEGCVNSRIYYRVRSIISSTGYSVVFNYQTDNAGTGSAPVAGWRTTSGMSFGNSVTPVSPALASSHSYPSSGVVDVTDMGGRTWRLTTNAAGRISGIRRPGAASDTTTYSYTAGGTVNSVTKDGVTTSYNRVVSGSTATMTVTNALSQQTVVTSDLTKGRVTSVQNVTLNRTTSFQYDANGRLTRTTQPEGNYTQLTLDGRGNVTQSQSVAKSGSGLPDIVTTASFDVTCTSAVKCNKPNSATDARGYTTSYTYDPTHGGVTSITYPAPTGAAPTGSGIQPKINIAYSAVTPTMAGSTAVTLPTTISACQTAASCDGTADEVEVVTAYDGMLQPASRTSRNGTQTLTATSAMTYDPVGNLATVDGPLPGSADTTKYRYNNARQVVGTISADPDGAGPLKHRAVQIVYDSSGRVNLEKLGTVNSQSDADWAAFAESYRHYQQYNVKNQLDRETWWSAGVDYAVIDHVYDAVGRHECSITYMNPAVWGPLASTCQPLQTNGPNGPDRVAKTVYNAAGEVLELRIGVGSPQERVERAQTYTSNGQLATLTDAENNKTTYVYDGHDRLFETHYPVATKGAGTSSSTDYETPLFDPNGNVIYRRLRDGQVITFTYDNLNRPTLKNLPGSEPDVSYAYDNLNRLTSLSQTGNALSFTFDALGRNLTQTGPQGTVTADFDLAGRRTKLTYPGSGLYVEYDYLVTGETTKIRENGATSGIGVLATYAYDDLGRQTTLTYGNGVSTSYGYDAVSRLSSFTANLAGTTNDLTVGSIAYKPASQITGLNRSNDAYAWTGSAIVNRPYTSNGLNQLTLSGTIVPTYDARGNLTSAGTTTYTYNSENMLVSASGGSSATLSYDPGLRLYQVSGATTTRFAYDGLDMLAEYDGGNLLLRRYVHGPGMDQPLVQYEGTGTTDRRFLSADERGSVIATTDSAGALITANSYDEYGIPGSGNIGRFQYTRQAWLPELGMYHYKNRIYSPTLGRFLQTDPIGYGDGMNIYAYVKNDPINSTDPLGLADGEDISVMGCQGAFWYLCYREMYMEFARARDGSGPGTRNPGEVAERRTNQCAAAASGPKKYSIPPGYKPYRGDPQNRYVLDSNNVVQLNPNYQSVVESTKVDKWGVFLDLAKITLFSIPIVGEYLAGAHATVKTIDITVAASETAQTAIDAENEMRHSNQNSNNNNSGNGGCRNG